MIEAHYLGQRGGRGGGELELLEFAELCYTAPRLVVGAALGEHGDETFVQVPLGTEERGGYMRAPHMSKSGKRGVSAKYGLQ